MSKLVKFSPILVGVIALAVFVAYINFPVSEPKQGGFRGGSTPVVIATVSQEAFPVVIEALGTSVANESVNITAQQAEIVKAVYFQDGDKVSKGQRLLELNNTEELAQVNELNINIDEAQRQLKRIKGLAKSSAASEQLLDEQRARVDALSAQRDVAEARLAKLVISAPFAGKLGTRDVSVGSLVRPGDLITTLDDLSLMKVDFSISESHLATIALKQKVYASSVAYPGQRFEGQISSIDSRIDPVTRSIQIRAQIPNPKVLLRPGMLLQINLEKRVLDTLIIPESALIPEGDQQYVFIVDENSEAHKKAVKLGVRKPGFVEVLEGLVPGQALIVEGTLRVREGSKVNVTNPVGA